MMGDWKKICIIALVHHSRHKELVIVAIYFRAPFLATNLCEGTLDAMLELILSIVNISQHLACIGEKKESNHTNNCLCYTSSYPPGTPRQV